MSVSEAARDPSPRAFFQLVGHPLRWQLVRELARSDRVVHELTGLLGASQNLVSYHLGKLRAARLVSARRSSADGRDSYYSVDLTRLRAMLATAGAAWHPGLWLLPQPDDQSRSEPVPEIRVLFLCTGNSSRSQIAEALVRARSNGAVEAFSAGSHPKPLHPNAVRVMREYGIDLGHHHSKHLQQFAEQRFDFVISLCDRVREVCPDFPGLPEAIHWSIADPAAAGDGPGDGEDPSYAAFRRTAAELDTRIGFLLDALRHPHPATPVWEEP